MVKHLRGSSNFGDDPTVRLVRDVDHPQHDQLIITVAYDGTDKRPVHYGIGARCSMNVEVAARFPDTPAPRTNNFYREDLP